MDRIQLYIGENNVHHNKTLWITRPQVDGNIVVQVLLTHKHSHIIAN